jgi:small subunit ribosomal protein S16
MAGFGTGSWRHEKNMSVKLRMTRAGAKKRPFYHLVAADGRAARDGKFLERIGYYDPTADPSVLKIDEERLQFWLDRGAQTSELVTKLIKRHRREAPPATSGS